MDKELAPELDRHEGDFEEVNPNSQMLSSRRCMALLCTSLQIDTAIYSPEESIRCIKKYIKKGDTLGRVLYSEFSNFIYSLDEKGRGKCATNLEKMVDHVVNNGNKLNEDCVKIVIKLYDHFHLTLYQIDNVKGTFADDAKNIRNNLSSQIKDVQKEYITILGIFASIILTFVSGITFSNSVLSNINQVSKYRLFLTIDALALILINLVYILLKFILHINNKQSKNFLPIILINIILGVLGAVIMAAWFFDPLGVKALA